MDNDFVLDYMNSPIGMVNKPTKIVSVFTQVRKKWIFCAPDTLQAFMMNKNLLSRAAIHFLLKVLTH